MEKKLFEELLDELKMQVNFSIISINLLNEQFEKMNDSNADQEQSINTSYKFWYSIQNYVVSLANISKILYGVKGKTANHVWLNRKNERKILRQQLKLSDNNSFRNRDMRNLLEHIDENIEKFVSSKPKFVVNKIISPSVGGIHIGDKSIYDEGYYNLRSYLTDLNEFWLFDKKFNLENTFKEVLFLKDSVIALENKLRVGELNDIFGKGDSI